MTNVIHLMLFEHTPLILESYYKIQLNVYQQRVEKIKLQFKKGQEDIQSLKNSINELNKAIQYGTTIEDFKNIPVAPKDNFDHEMLPSMPRP